MKAKRKWTRNRKPSVNTPQYLATLEGLSVPQLKQKLLERMENSEAAQRRFWKKADVRGPEDCWNWRATVSWGYGVYTGRIAEHRFNFRAHRVAYYFQNKFLPDNCLICHHCDNPKCINPKHLFIGTPQDNVDDMVSKLRQARGEKQAAHKLTSEQVNEIRFLRYVKNLKVDEIAKQFGLGRSAISSATRGVSWKHIPVVPFYE